MNTVLRFLNCCLLTVCMTGCFFDLEYNRKRGGTFTFGLGIGSVANQKQTEKWISKNGLLQGQFRHDGTPAGVWQQFYPNGVAEYLAFFPEEGVPVFVSRFPNGMPKSKGVFECSFTRSSTMENLPGLRHQEFWDFDGNKIRQEDVPNPGNTYFEYPAVYPAMVTSLYVYGDTACFYGLRAYYMTSGNHFQTAVFYVPDKKSFPAKEIIVKGYMKSPQEAVIEQVNDRGFSFQQCYVTDDFLTLQFLMDSPDKGNCSVSVGFHLKQNEAKN